MRKTTAAAGTVLFLFIVPGTVVGVLPWWLTGWRSGDPYPVAVRLVGAALLATGSLILPQAFARFVMEGVGTPAPVAPTQRLVIGGLYTYVRNPMYLAVLAAIVGQALVLGRPVLFAYAVAVAAAVVTFVRAYEEPTLARRYGAEYEAYRKAVPGWWPRPPRRGRRGAAR